MKKEPFNKDATIELIAIGIVILSLIAILNGCGFTRTRDSTIDPSLLNAAIHGDMKP